MKIFLGRDIIKPKIYAERIFYLLYHFLKLSYHSPERGGAAGARPDSGGEPGEGGGQNSRGPGPGLINAGSDLAQV